MESLIIWLAILVLVHFFVKIVSRFLSQQLQVVWQDEHANRADFHFFKIFIISLRNYSFAYRESLQKNFQALRDKKVSFRTAFVGVILCQENFVLALFALLLFGKVNFYWMILAGGVAWWLGQRVTIFKYFGTLLGGLGALLFFSNELFAKVSVFKNVLGQEQWNMLLLDKSPETLAAFAVAGLILGAALGSFELLLAVLILLVAGVVHLYVAFYFAFALIWGERLLALLRSRDLAFQAQAQKIWNTEIVFLAFDLVLMIFLAPTALALLTVYGGSYDPYLRGDQWLAVMIGFQVSSLGLRSLWAHFYYKKNAEALELKLQ